MPYKDFVAGTTLPAADVDTYLMRQTVMTFASAAARDSALVGVLAEGMTAYLADVNRVTVYDGAVWVTTSNLTATITGNTTGTTDASGDLAISFGVTFSAAPIVVACNGEETQDYYMAVYGQTTTGCTVRVRTGSTGAVVASQAVRILWHATGVY